MIWTEEAGILITLAKDPNASVRRSDLVRDARLINKAVLGMDGDVHVTNSTVDSLLAQRLIEKAGGELRLTLEGAQAMLSLSQRTQLLGEILAKTGALAGSGEFLIPEGQA